MKSCAGFARRGEGVPGSKGRAVGMTFDPGSHRSPDGVCRLGDHGAAEEMRAVASGCMKASAGGVVFPAAAAEGFTGGGR